MIISSLVVEALPGKAEELSATLDKLEGVETHGVQENQVVVTIETETVEESHALASSFVHLEGAVNVNLVYANFEEDPFIKKAVER